MGRFLLYIAIAYILWRIVRAFTSGGTRPPEVRGTPPREQRVASRRAAEIDYTRVRDADYREVDERERQRRSEHREGDRRDEDRREDRRDQERRDERRRDDDAHRDERRDDDRRDDDSDDRATGSGPSTPPR